MSAVTSNSAVITNNHFNTTVSAGTYGPLSGCARFQLCNTLFHSDDLWSLNCLKVDLGRPRWSPSSELQDAICTYAKHLTFLVICTGNAFIWWRNEAISFVNRNRPLREILSRDSCNKRRAVVPRAPVTYAYSRRRRTMLRS